MVKLHLLILILLLGSYFVVECLPIVFFFITCYNVVSHCNKRPYTYPKFDSQDLLIEFFEHGKVNKWFVDDSKQPNIFTTGCSTALPMYGS